MLLNKQISIRYFLNVIKGDILVIFSYGVLAFYIRHFHYLQDITIPLAVASLIGTLISLLLAFRTSQSYERWWEARIVWGAIVNDSRTFIRQLMQFLPKTEAGMRYVQRCGERHTVWLHALGEALRRVEHSELVRNYLEQHGIESNNIPNALLDRQAADLAQAAAEFDLNPNIRVQLDTTLLRFTDSMGKCERIKSTIFPKSYSVLIHFTIYLFLAIFPFGLSEVGEAGEAFLSILVPMLFIIIERTAILMQDPFENRPTDTPMTQLAQTIGANIQDMISGTKTPKPEAAPDTYYVM